MIFTRNFFLLQNRDLCSSKFWEIILIINYS